MKIKEQTRKAAGCSKHCFEVVDDQNTILVVDETDEVSNRCSQNHIYGKATLTRFEFDFRRVLTSHKGSWELRNVLFQ
ncbi:hypothetical protein [Streptococcus pneumoniae]|uniref:hypothetical protein n=1 Tax=Streptococcus pneumoniae TaxID=1313 RepID=UPI00070AB422|nr:hypothetical protein [Streptococcus pneumoniae]